MTRATRYFLTQLKDYLKTKGPKKRRELRQLHEKLADGKKLHSVSLSRHLNLQMTPLLDTGIVYLRFAQVNGIIEADPESGALFRYVSAKTQQVSGKKKVK